MSLSPGLAFNQTFFGSSANPPSTIAGSADGSAFATGSILGISLLSGISGGSAATQGDLTSAITSNNIFGVSDGASTVSGSIVGSGALAGSVSAIAAAAGLLTSNHISGSVSGIATSFANLINNHMNGSSAGSSTAVGSMGDPLQVAFPGAEGYGKFAKGARASGSITIYTVNNQSDLETALTASGSRIVIFGSSGDYRWTSGLTVGNGNLTVLGQTAPSPGVMISGTGVNIRASEQIWRGVAFRRGNNPSGASDTVSIAALPSTAPISNIIFDHCDFSWGADGTVDFNGENENVTDCTIQNSAIYENVDSSNNLSLLNAAAGGGFVDRISYNRVFFTQGKGRFPFVSEGIVCDVTNCLMYNWASRATQVGPGATGQSYGMYVGNFFKSGPSTNGGGVSRCIDLGNNGTATDVQMFVKGNIGGDRPNDTLAENLIVAPNDRNLSGISSTVVPFSGEFDYANMSIGSDIEASVRDTAGAFYFDTERARMITEYNSDAARGVYSVGTFPSFPTYAVNTRNHATDFTTWANANGFGAQNNLATNGADVEVFNGWSATLVEHYAETLIP
jgi:hypothetical protein